ncbi:MAG: hypothetical protein OEN50_10635 [Deltaproteobacteria bacterium]|nr:hypothetical protein [Deltaproteobacteria bacterium]
MNKFKAWFIGGAIITTAAFAVPIFLHADGDGHKRFGRRPGAHRMFGGGAPLISIALRHQSELKLTADQVANLESTKTHYRTQMEPVYDQLKSIEEEIANLLQETPANLVQVKLKVQEAEKFRSELRYLRIEALENGKTILSGEQLEQLKSLLAARRAERHKYHRHGGREGQAS